MTEWFGVPFNFVPMPRSPHPCLYSIPASFIEHQQNFRPLNPKWIRFPFLSLLWTFQLLLFFTLFLKKFAYHGPAKITKFCETSSNLGSLIGADDIVPSAHAAALRLGLWLSDSSPWHPRSHLPLDGAKQELAIWLVEEGKNPELENR